MNKIKVDVGFDKLKYIHHTSDIQIRNLRRHTEYRQVLDNFYQEVEKYKEFASMSDILLFDKSALEDLTEVLA